MIHIRNCKQNSKKRRKSTQVVEVSFNSQLQKLFCLKVQSNSNYLHMIVSLEEVKREMGVNTQTKKGIKQKPRLQRT